MTHTERRRYADAMARAAAMYMVDSDAQELANNLACSDPEEHQPWSIRQAIVHRVREFGVKCDSPMSCASDVMMVVKAYRRKSA